MALQKTNEADEKYAMYNYNKFSNNIGYLYIKYLFIYKVLQVVANQKKYLFSISNYKKHLLQTAGLFYENVDALSGCSHFDRIAAVLKI